MSRRAFCRRCFENACQACAKGSCYHGRACRDYDAQITFTKQGYRLLKGENFKVPKPPDYSTPRAITLRAREEGTATHPWSDGEKLYPSNAKATWDAWDDTARGRELRSFWSACADAKEKLAHTDLATLMTAPYHVRNARRKKGAK